MRKSIIGIIAVLCICSIFILNIEDTTASAGHGSFDTPLSSISTDAYTFLGDTTSVTYDEWYLEPYGSVDISVYEDRIQGISALVTSISGNGSEYLTLDNGALSGTVDTDVADISVEVTVYTRGGGNTTLTNKIIIPDTTDYTHTVYYDANGGTATGVEPAGGFVSTVTDHNSGMTNVTLIMSPFYKEGYDFIGWDVNGTVYQPGESVPVAGFDTVTATAQWGLLHKYTVTYDGNGGTSEDTVPDSIKYSAVGGNATVTLIQNPYEFPDTPDPMDPTPVEKGFTGWSVGGVIYLPGESVSVAEDTTVVAIAQWVPHSSQTYTHTVQYNAGTGAGTMTSTVLTDYIDGYSYVTLSTNSFTHPGYVFTGWQIGTEMYSEGVAIPVNAGTSVTATAQWVSTSSADWTHTIIYDLNGGSGVFTDTVVTNKSSIPSPVALSSSTPLMSGFTFIGWRIVGGEYVQADGTYANYNGELIKVITEDWQGNPLPPTTILVEGGEVAYAIAQWRDLSQYFHRIEYASGGGQGAMANTVITDNYRGYTNVPLASNGFTREHYYFEGWDVNGTQYNPGDLVPVLGNAWVTATALWSEHPKYTRTIIYNANGGDGTMANTVQENYDSGGYYVPLASNGFTREGYVFTGWDVDGTIYQPGESVLIWAGFSKTAYAQWEEVVVPTYIHSISYRSNGGSGSMQNTSVTDTVSGNTLLTLAPNGFTRTGFNFTGWDVDGTIYQPYDQIPVAGNDTKIATAQWLVIQYTHTITYDANGGTGAMTNTVVTDTNSGESNVLLANCGFTKEGYAFMGWSITTGSIVHTYQPGTPIPVAGNSVVTATASWGTYTHTIEYEANQGTGVMADTVVTDTVSGNTNVPLASNGFTRSGYTFIGWSLNSASTSQLYQPGDTLSVAGNSSRTVYAMWDPILYTHTIVYDANGGDGTMANTVVTDMVSGITNVPLSANGFTRTGYDFMGWSVNNVIYSSGASIPIAGNTSVTATAVWSYVYTHTLRYNANGGTGTMVDTVITDYDPNAVNITLLPCGYTLSGSNFVGWLVNGNVLQPTDTVPVAGDTIVTATAQWDVITYSHTIVYNANGGTGTMTNTVVIDTNSGNSNVTLATNDFENTGYDFAGWLVNGSILQAGQSVAVAGDSSVTATAQWTLSEYTHTIVYDANGGTGAMTNTVVTDNTAGDTYVILSPNGFTRTEYDAHGILVEYAFTGWSVNNVVYQPAQSVPVAGDSSVTAIAQWVLITYTHTITYRANNGEGTMTDTVITNAYSTNTNVPLSANGFTRTGYSFTGWLVNGTVYQPADTIPVAGNDVAIATAQWLEDVYTHTIVYNANGGNGSMSNTVVTNNVSGVTYVTLDSNEFTRNGYLFTGWDVNGTVYQPGESVAVGGNFTETAYAQWAENVLPTYYHTIQYSPNGGLGYMSDTTVINTTIGNTNVTLATCGYVRLGYDFSGWVVNGTAYSEGDTIPVAGNTSVTAIAQWSLSTYTHTIKYYPNGGIGTMSDTTITNNNMGNTLVPLATCGFVRSGYIFTGWEYDGMVYQPAQSIPVAGGIVAEVYAQWSAITYTHTISYNPNGAEGTMQDTVITDTNSGNIAVTLSPNGYTRTGWIFKGWNVSGALYQPGQTVLVAGNTVALAIAQWSESTLTVSTSNIVGYSGEEYQTQISAVPNNNGTVAFGTATCTGGTATVTPYGLVMYTAPHVTSQEQYTITVSVTATYPDGYTITQNAVITATINPASQSVVITNGTSSIETEPTEQGGYHVEDVSFNGETCEYLIAPQYTEVTVENELDGSLIKTLIGILPILMIIGIVVYIARRMTTSSR